MTTWIESVFSMNNAFDLSRIEGSSEKYPGPLGQHLSTMLANARKWPNAACIPRLDHNKQIKFYLVAESTEQVTELRNLVQAHLGNAYCSLDPTVHISSKDPMELALLEEYPKGFIRISIPIACNIDKPKVFWVMQSLNEMIDQYCSRPITFSLRQRPVGRILRDLLVSLREGNSKLGSEYIEELRTKNQLSAQNLLYLELQLHESVQKWGFITEHPRISDLVGGRLPRKVLSIILRALAMTSLRPEIIQTSTPETVREGIQSISALFYRDLDVTRYSKNSPELQAWFIGAMAVGNQRASMQLSDYLDPEWSRSVLQWAGMKIGQSVTITGLSTLDSLLTQPPSLEVANQLLQSSITADQEQAAKITETLSTYPPKLVDTLRSNQLVSKILNALEQQFSGVRHIDGWTDFFAHLSDEKRSEQLFQIAVNTSQEWPANSWDEAVLNESLDNNFQDPYILRNTLPVLLSWLEERDIALRSATHLQLLLLLAADEVVSVPDLSLCRDLLCGILFVPHTEDEYQDALYTVEECWSKVESTAAVPGILDIMEVLLDSPCADMSRRRQSWEYIQQFLVGSWARLSEPLCLLCQELAKGFLGTNAHLQLARSEPEENVPANVIDLTDKKLAIYTLTEGAGRRAKKALQHLCPGLEITLNHDKTASDALVHLARTADYFVFASRSAAHQAFYPVTRERDDLIYPAGKGSSSIITSFMNVLEKEYAL